MQQKAGSLKRRCSFLQRLFLFLNKKERISCGLTEPKGRNSNTQLTPPIPNFQLMSIVGRLGGSNSLSWISRDLETNVFPGQTHTEGQPPKKALDLSRKLNQHCSNRRCAETI